jgi:prepilin-type N-terminal cleavage/methylation domain-containing protein
MIKPHHVVKRRKRLLDDCGFTLVEMAIVIVILGVIVSIAATALPPLIASSKIKKTRALLEKAEHALQGYSMVHHRLPFAAGAPDGIETSDLFVGYIPYRTLGLSTGADAWGNVLRYAVYGESGGTANLTQVFADADAFCAAISAAATAAFSTTIVHSTSADLCSGAAVANSSNQAHVLASGGSKDLDGTNGLFDMCNGQSNPGFNSPAKIQTANYDDLVLAFSITELNFKNCAASGGSGGTGAGEHTYAGGCSNGADDDGDGSTDCSDADCSSDPACSAAGSHVVITTTTIPSGTGNSLYSATFQAAGGTPPYEWNLTDNGGFTDFSLNTYTGLLSGTLDQCPGSYAIGVQVQDSTLAADGGPTLDAKTFSLQVTSGLTVSRAGGSGTRIFWDSSLHQETFTAAGERFDDIAWSLDTGGATGFVVISSSSDTGVVKKNGSTIAGSYTFTLTATDALCPANTDHIVLSVTVTGSGGGAPGDIAGIVDVLEFDSQSGLEPEIIKIADEIFAIAYSGADSDGWLKTIRIADDGSIVDPQIDTFRFAPQFGDFPRIIPVSGDIYAVVYQGANDDGWLQTVQITADGQIGNSAIDFLEFDDKQATAPDIVNVSGNYFAISYQGDKDDGWLKTVEITADGRISDTPVDSLEFDAKDGKAPDILHIAGDVFAIAYSGGGKDGQLKTLKVNAAGVIGDPQIDSMTFETDSAEQATIIPVSDNIYAITYQGPDKDGWLKTVAITPDGQIAGAPLDSFEFEPNNGQIPRIINISGNYFAVAYSGPGTDGWTSTIEILDSGQIAVPVINSLEFDSVFAASPSMALVSGNAYVVAYSGSNNEGLLKTIGLAP